MFRSLKLSLNTVFELVPDINGGATRPLPTSWGRRGILWGPNSRTTPEGATL